MRITGILAALAGSALLLAGPGASQPTAQPMALAPRVSLRPSAAAPAAPVTPAQVTPAGAHALDGTDVNAWLDGYMPYALASGDIAGAVVVVVKDGQVLTERGYGYADVKTARPVDPKTTLFRPGSVSKLFTWTAVMQLVQAGKIDLDADVNGYLDFKIPARDGGKPITMRNLMTHTPGLEEKIKHLFDTDAKHITPLRDYVADWVPHRIYPAGEIAAYSNYGAALAGYIVQRISGEAFNDYVERHIFQPLGMSHSTFVQPLPANLKADMSSGYIQASLPTRPFELVAAAPAGALSTAGDDMGRFMITYLQQGGQGAGQILRPHTVKQMLTTNFSPTPPLPGMALGFYHEDRNGHVIVGHAGDTEAFHSDLHLFPGDGVGLFVSVNSLGRQGAAEQVRAQLLRGFTDRYFPVPPVSLPTMASAKHDAAMMAGTYWFSRRSDSSFLRILNLVGQAKVTALPDGVLEFKAFKTPGGAVKKWREVGPFLWQEVNGESRLAAVVRGGRVTAFTSDDLPPAFVFQPVPAAFNAGWNLPLLFASLAILALAVVLWPISAIARRRYGARFALVGRPATLYRLVRGVAIVDLLIFAGWMVVLAAVGADFTLLNGPILPLIRVIQVLEIIGIIGSVVAVLNLVTVWGDGGRGWWAKVSSLALMVACVSVVWFVFSLKLLSLGLNF